MWILVAHSILKQHSKSRHSNCYYQHRSFKTTLLLIAWLMPTLQMLNMSLGLALSTLHLCASPSSSILGSSCIYLSIGPHDNNYPLITDWILDSGVSHLISSYLNNLSPYVQYDGNDDVVTVMAMFEYFLCWKTDIN